MARQSNREQVPVLVDIVKLVDFPERFIPAAVRFDRIDCEFGVFPHSLYLPSLSGFVSGDVLRDRELDLPRIRGPLVVGPDKNKLICEMIEGAPEILNHVSGGGKNIKWH